MKAAFITALALATSAIAAPAGLPNPTKITSEVKTEVSGTVSKALHLGGSAASAASSTTPSAAAIAVPSDSPEGHHLLHDVGKGANKVLTVTGPDAKKLLVELSPEVSGLLAGLGLPAVGTSVGSIVKTAGNLGDLVKDLGPKVEGLLSVVGKDAGALLIQLDPSVAGLLSGLGLPGVGTSVGSIVGTVGANLKRDDGLVQDVAPQAKNLLKVTGKDSEELLIELSPEVAALVNGLGLHSLAGPLGSVIKTVGKGVGGLLQDIAAPLEQTLTVVGDDGSHLLVHLAPSVAGLLAGLGLPAPGTAVGHVVKTVGKNL